MTVQTRTVNKARFEDGDKPTGSHYADLVDSFVAIADTTAQALSSDLSAVKLIGTTEVSSPQVNATEVSASVVNTTIGNIDRVNAATVSASVVNAGTLNAQLVSASVANINILNVQAVSASSGTYQRLRVGSSAADLGDVILCRQVSVPSNNTKIAVTRIPDGADIVDLTMFVQTPPSSSALSTTNILIGTSAHDDRIARFTNVTAQGYYRVSSSVRTSGWLSVSGANALLHVHTTAASGAIASAASGRIHIFYVKRQ